jgi:hypothetical protein
MRSLDPYSKVEGTRNNHSFTQYDIAIYSVKLNESGLMAVLDKISKMPDDWEWFTSADIINGKRADGKSAFVDALMQMSKSEVAKFLFEEIPDCNSTPQVVDLIELPPTLAEPIIRGDRGKKDIQVSLTQGEWELLMLLGWHVRNLEILIHEEWMKPLGGGWIQISSNELLDIAKGLANKLASSGLRLINFESRGYCRLSIATNNLYFHPDCFEYFWDVESEDKPIILTLKGIKTGWGELKSQSVSLRLPPSLILAMPALEKERETETEPETIAREFRRVLLPAESLGLRQFTSTWKGANRLLVKPALV